MAERENAFELPNEFKDKHGLTWRVMPQKMYPIGSSQFAYRHIIRIEGSNVVDQGIVRESEIRKAIEEQNVRENG